MTLLDLLHVESYRGDRARRVLSDTKPCLTSAAMTGHRSTYSVVNSPPYTELVSYLQLHHDRLMMSTINREIHTASTRRSEVLPAFCRPIMVTSISVALSSRRTPVSILGAYLEHPLRKPNKLSGTWKDPRKEQDKRTRKGARANHRCFGTSRPCRRRRLWKATFSISRCE